MATKKKATKKRATKEETVYCPECEAFSAAMVRALHASGSATTAPTTTLAALLAAARGIELVMASRPCPNGESIADIGAAHALAATIDNENLRVATEIIIESWARPPAEATKPLRGSKTVTRKRKARK